MMKSSHEKSRTKGSILKERYNNKLLILSNAFTLENHNLKHRIELRRHKVRMKIIFYSAKWRLRTELAIKQSDVVNKRCKSSVLINSRYLVSWLLFVCVLFSVSCNQQNCDIIRGNNNKQEKATRQYQERVNQQLLINKQSSRTIVRSLPKEQLGLSTSDIRINRANSPLNWLNRDDIYQEHSSRSSISNLRQKFKRDNRPYFKAKQAKRVIASRWQTEVFLPCQIENLDEEQTVSWIRKRDSLVLTIDKLKLIDDPRFQLAQNNQNWTLVLSQPTSQDAGFYECQVSSTEPRLSRVIELRMVEAISRISNFTSLFVRPNEVLNVTCFIEAPQDTDFVYWYKNKDPIQFDNLKPRRRTSLSSKGQKDKGGQFRKKMSKPVRMKSRHDYKTKNTFITAAESSSSSLYNSNSNDSKRFFAHNLAESGQENLKMLNLSEVRGIPENVPNLGFKQERESEKDKEIEEEEDYDDGDNDDDDDDYEEEYEDETNNSNDPQDKRQRRQKHAQLSKSSSSLIIKQTQLNDTANYTCLKLPNLDPEMRDALRSHIIRKRQRLKQELEQDAIEKRLKREKELKQLQDAMTLDQIKEQLSVLETKLQTLKDEKHNLFIELKQVLNEDSTRQKQHDQSSDERKQSEEKNDNHTQDTMGSGDVNNLTSPAQNIKQSDSSPFSNPPPKVDTNQMPPRRPAPIARRTPPKNNPIRPNHTPYSINNNNSYLGPPLSQVPLTYPAKQGSSPRQINQMNTKPMHYELHLPSPRAPLLSGPIQELISPTSLNFSHQQRIQAPHLNNNNMPFLMDLQASFDTGLNHQTSMKPVAGCKRSLSVANLNDSIDERSPVRKGSNFIHSNPNQFILDSVPPHGIPNLSQYNPMNHPRSSLPMNPIGTPVPSSNANLIQQNTNLIPRKQLSHQQLSNFDYMINSRKSGVMVPGLNLFYPPHPSRIPQTSLYSGFEGELRHLTSPYYSSAQQYGNTSRPSNLPPLLPTENSSQYLTAANLAYNAARFPPHSKNHFSTNK